jgi:oxygen-independent coproporphyrinogen-3 oxidase
MISKFLNPRNDLAQIHLGGGTPTFLTEAQLDALMKKIRDCFNVLPDAEIAVEVNPAVTSHKKVSLLAGLGFNRISVGVQDLTPRVLEAIGRPQTKEQVASLVDHARQCGFKSINADMIYGLPYQTVESFNQTLDEIMLINPDRTALYSFAFLPRIMKNQSRMNSETLPGRDEKFALFAAAYKKFIQNGYIQIGMDHFAKRDDELARAAINGSLYRNFMGYTVNRHREMVGVGASAISFAGGCFAQNIKNTDRYIEMVQSGELPVFKGLKLSFDDSLRQYIIMELMCNFKIDQRVVEQNYGIDFKEYFKEELAELSGQRLDELPFTSIEGDVIRLTPEGRLFVRNVCMVFDARLKNLKKGKPLFSRTV